MESEHSLSHKLFYNASYTERILFLGLVAIFLFSGLILLLKLNDSLLVEVPLQGGSITEGMVGSPRFINPVIAVSETDKDLVALTYSGLTRIMPSGEIIPDLAESYTISDDGLEYTFTIREDATFHDGTPVTASDVAYTIQKVVTPIIRSPERANWEGVLVETPSEREVRITIPERFPAFIYNTTLGILPSHIWQAVSDEEFPFTERNISPVGSGPYRIAEINKNSAGIAESYELEAFDDFSLGAPSLETISLQFYRNEAALLDALADGSVESSGGITPSAFATLDLDQFAFTTYDLPRLFGIFFNQNKSPILSDNDVRLALEQAVDRDMLTQEVLAGFAAPTDGPLPATYTASSSSTVGQGSLEVARTTLVEADFELNEEGAWESPNGTPLQFTLTTANVPELAQAATLLATTWKELGADVTVNIVDREFLSQNTIRPREFEAILFGQVIGRDIDLYPFWHSSQRNDPGLNIAGYTNIDADAALEDARTLENLTEKQAALVPFLNEVRQDIPAIFLYTPEYVYVIPEDLRGISSGMIMQSSDRFNDVHTWFIETDRVWNFFI